MIYNESNGQWGRYEDRGRWMPANVREQWQPDPTKLTPYYSGYPIEADMIWVGRYVNWEKHYDWGFDHYDQPFYYGWKECQKLGIPYYPSM